MYMRYAGGGIGHYKVDLMEGSRDSVPPPESEPTALINAAADASDTSDTAGNHGDANFQTADDAATNVLRTADNVDGCPHVPAEGEDSESDCEDLQTESEGSDIEDNFGAEEGEAVFGDVEDEEGYAPL